MVQPHQAGAPAKPAHAQGPSRAAAREPGPQDAPGAAVLAVQPTPVLPQAACGVALAHGAPVTGNGQAQASGSGGPEPTAPAAGTAADAGAAAPVPSEGVGSSNGVGQTPGSAITAPAGEGNPAIAAEAASQSGPAASQPGGSAAAKPRPASQQAAVRFTSTVSAANLFMPDDAGADLDAASVPPGPAGGGADASLTPGPAVGAAAHPARVAHLPATQAVADAAGVATAAPGLADVLSGTGGNLAGAPDGGGLPGGGQAAAPAPATPGQASAPVPGQPTPPPLQPAAQLGQAVAGLHVGADGSSRLTVQLAPESLGQVRLQITRDAAGAAAVSVQVERADTLGRLQADIAHLHQALDRAGVPEQRQVTVHLMPAQASTPDGGAAGAGLGQGAQGGGSQGGPNGGNQGAQHGRSRQPTYQTADARPMTGAGPPQTYDRSGLNITA